ncbi:helix-turn-helix domain-containing protein [Methylobacterium sp. sgz302541]|uniref:helix-turn-helix domain-containing protein n=1 Tax=unclassified Methylobacterium TaxID=2615210 RepID=UPI003D337331
MGAVTADAVLDRVRIMTGLKRDIDLARLFAVSKSTITTWRRRNRVPYSEILALHFEKKLDFSYCILGIQQYNHLNLDLDLGPLKADLKFWEAFRRFRTEMRRVYGPEAGEETPEGYKGVTRTADDV